MPAKQVLQVECIRKLESPPSTSPTLAEPLNYAYIIDFLNSDMGVFEMSTYNFFPIYTAVVVEIIFQSMEPVLQFTNGF